MSTSTEQAPNHLPESSKKRKPILVLACVALIVIVISGASMFWLTRSKGNPPAIHHPSASPTATMARPILTPNALTPSSLAMFYDAFAGNFNGWYLGSNGGYFRIMVNDSLILADTNPRTTMIESFPTLTNLDNYVVSVAFTINQGDGNDGTGLYLRGDSRLDHDYRIDVNGNNTVDIVKEYLDANQASQTTTLAPATHTAYLNPPGQSNTLTVLMIDQQIIVEINNIVVLTATDAAYTNGQVALFARHGATSKGVTVSITRVEIDRL
ncbi:MAG TPA: hypothetical protein VHD63_24855, partial [Ktedonobacteraceae bacterium]|nr:hypothetical protein [Ktedonobacteraceae bacterium]